MPWLPLPRCCGVIPQEPSSRITVWSVDVRIQQVRQTASRESEKAKNIGPWKAYRACIWMYVKPNIYIYIYKKHAQVKWKLVKWIELLFNIHQYLKVYGIGFPTWFPAVAWITSKAMASFQLSILDAKSQRCPPATGPILRYMLRFEKKLHLLVWIPSCHRNTSSKHVFSQDWSM